MSDKQNEPKLTYALDSSGKMVSIRNVERGLACNCRCPKCKEALVAKLGHEGGRQPHFAHQKDSDCHGSYMTALHMLAQQIIEEDKQVMLPDYQGKYIQKSTNCITFDLVRLEEIIPINDGQIRADCVGYKQGKDNNAHRLLIEILVTHEVDDNKSGLIKSLNESCIEINLSDLIETGYTREDVANRLKENKEDRKWINCPVYDKCDKEKEQKEEEKKRKEEARRKELKDKVNKWYKDGDKDIAAYIISDIKRYPLLNVDNSKSKKPNPLFECLVPANNYLYYIDNSPKNDDGLNLFYILLRFYYSQTKSVDFQQLKDRLKVIQCKHTDLTSEEKIRLEELISLRVMYILVKQRARYHDIPSAVKEYNDKIRVYHSEPNIRNGVLMISSVIYHHIVGSNAQNFGELTREIILHHPSIARTYLRIINNQSKYPNDYKINNCDTLQELKEFIENSTEVRNSIVDEIIENCFCFSYRSDIIEKINVVSFYASHSYDRNITMKEKDDWDDWYDSLN